MSFTIEQFYILFEGVMLFQIAFFGMAYLLSKRKDVLYYCLLNLFSALYFFLNAPDTFLGIDEDIVFNHPSYVYVNFALFMCMFFMYLVFLKEIFSDTVSQYPLVKKIYSITFYSIPVLYLLFVLFSAAGWNTNLLFYTGHLINGPFCTLILLLNFTTKGYKKLIIYGMVVIFICVVTTIILTVRYNAGKSSLLLDKYPLAIIKMGMLIDIILFQFVLLKRWQEQENELSMQHLTTELAVEKVKSQISKELHDDVGSTLSGISMYSHMAKEQTAAGNMIASGQTLGVIQQASEEMILKLKDMVWAMQPGNETIGQLTSKINEYAVFITGAKKIALQTNFLTANDEVKLSTEVIHQVYTIAKEALNNAVKYSGANTITIDTAYNDDCFTLRIADNGVGFDRAEATGGNGLINMKKRSEEMGAVLELITAVQLQLKLTH
jgi:signal transduction histidine kinase